MKGSSSAITPEQVEGCWEALASLTKKEGRLSNASTHKAEVAEAKRKVLDIFNQKSMLQTEFTGFSQGFGEFCTPRLISEFIAGVAKRIKPASIFDPACGHCLLLASVGSAAEAKTLRGIEINSEVAERADRIWEGAIEVIKGEALSLLEKNKQQYDMIISDPPLGLRLSTKQLEALQKKPEANDFTSALILSTLHALSPNGIGLFTVAPSFFLGSQREKFLNGLHGAGFRISACIQVPCGTRLNTSIATYLIVVNRGEQGDVFIGQLKDDDAHLEHILANFYRKRPKGDISLGRLCNLSSFQGYEGFAAREQLERLAREWGWSWHNGNDIIRGYEISRSGQPVKWPSLPEDTESIFIRLIGQPRASRQSEELPKTKDIAHIKLNTDLVEPAFFVYWLNESRIGRLTLGAVQTGVTIPRTELAKLIGTKIYLPSKEQQKCICEGWSYLQRVRSEADELESSLSDWSESPEQTLLRIRSINQEDRYEDWLESLPFPLASILWRHHAAKDTYRERYQMLLHFFEATAAFIATVHLSAYMSDDGEWERIGGDLSSKLINQGLSLERATFGAWKLVVERLASASAAVLKKSDQEKDQMIILEQIYGTHERQVLEMISHKKLLQVLQAANKIRNDNLGHAGAIGEDAARQIHEELLDLVYQLRGVFGRRWNRYELLQPGMLRYKAGTYYITCKRIMGTRSSPFEEREYESIMPLETDCLYLFDSMSRTGLKLQPFVEVIPSPERQAVACFIFNRVDKDGARWVSYHFDQESEITHPSSGVLSALSRLNRISSSRGPGQLIS